MFHGSRGGQDWLPGRGRGNHLCFQGSLPCARWWFPFDSSSSLLSRLIRNDIYPILFHWLRHLRRLHAPILMAVTLSPADRSSTPMLLAVIPLPSPLTTPPVTKMYFIRFRIWFPGWMQRTCTCCATSATSCRRRRRDLEMWREEKDPKDGPSKRSLNGRSSGWWDMEGPGSSQQHTNDAITPQNAWTRIKKVPIIEDIDGQGKSRIHSEESCTRDAPKKNAWATLGRHPCSKVHDYMLEVAP